MWTPTLWGLLLVCMTVIVVTWIRARHRRTAENPADGRTERSDLENKLDDELAARDRTIAKLEERIRVLERVVTERSAQLDDEFYRLRA